MSRLIIISNRLPFSIDKKGDQTSLRQSSGGLVSAISSYFERNQEGKGQFDENLWIGSAEFSPQEWDSIPQQETTIAIHPIFIDASLYSKYYDGFSNSTLWPLFHYFPSIVEFKREWYEAYTDVNRLFADKINDVLKEGDTIWIHDYQLMLLPGMIRKEHPEATIGFFLHIPFPSYEIFRLLPTEWKTEILQGVLGADLAGFHTPDYVQHFIQSVKMVIRADNQFNLLQLNNRLIKAEVFPIGIDFDKFSNAAFNEEIVQLQKDIIANHKERKIIFSVDRLDYSKGFMNRLDGFEVFLETHPEWIEKVDFILNVIPSRDKIPTYNEKKRQLEERISSLNGKFASLNWQPIIYRYNHLSFPELLASYQAADIALITPLRDGMNLVAKEFVASCTDQKGVLILSEFTGAASELSEALLVNPTDSRELAEAIQRAMNMELYEQKERMALMQKRLKDYDVHRWVNDFLEQLTLIKEEQRKMSVKFMDRKAIEDILDQYHASRKRLILLDYDGTLSPFRKSPAEARPDEKLLQLLEIIGSNEKNELVIISGRDPDTLISWLGKLPLHLVAEHGAFIKYRNKPWQEQATMAGTWKEQIKPILQLFVTRCAGSFLEEKKNTLTWHYRNTHPDLGFNRSRELMNTLLQLTGNTGLQVIDGNKVLEVRQTGIDKGITATKLVTALQPDFILCMGDDTTDEDMFKMLAQQGITIKIGNGNTAANFNMGSQEEVIPMLLQFVENTVMPA